MPPTSPVPAPPTEELSSGDSSFAANDEGGNGGDGGGAGGTIAAVVIVLIVLCMVALFVYVRRARARNASNGTPAVATSPMMTYGAAPQPGRGRSASRSRSRATSMRETRDAGGNGELYAPLELAKGTPLTYGTSGAEPQSTYGNLTVGPASPTYAVAQSYGSTARQQRTAPSTDLYAPVGGSDADSRYGTMSLAPSGPATRAGTATYDTASTISAGRYGTVSVGPAPLPSGRRYDTASAAATNALYTAPLQPAAGHDVYTAPNV